MPDRPALLRLLGEATDQKIADHLGPLGFRPATPLFEHTIRRYVATGAFRDLDIEVYRDARWDASGGRVRVALRSLIHPVQQAMYGVPQSLATPKLDVGTSVLQFGPHPDNEPGQWLVRSPAEVGHFANGFGDYLARHALPWYARSESPQAALAMLATMGPGEKHEQIRQALELASAQEPS
jgi:hypothetical protein